MITEARSIADLCYLAFTVLEGTDESLEYCSYPTQAVITATRYGTRPAHRPQTALPAAYAAHYMEHHAGMLHDAVRPYVEELIGHTLEQAELRKLMTKVRKQLKETAQKVAAHILKGLTEESVEQQIQEIENFRSMIDEATNPGLIESLLKLAQRRQKLFPKIKAGEFDRMDPVMLIPYGRHLGRATLSGAMLQAGETKVCFPVLPVPPSAPLRGVFICSVPLWYVYWVGDEKLFMPSGPKVKK